MDREQFTKGWEDYKQSIVPALEIFAEEESRRLWKNFKLRNLCNFSEQATFIQSEVNRIVDELCKYGDFSDIIEGYLQSIHNKSQLLDADDQSIDINIVHDRNKWVDIMADNIFDLQENGYLPELPYEVEQLLLDDDDDFLDFDLDELFKDDPKQLELLRKGATILALCRQCEDIRSFFDADKIYSKYSLPKADGLEGGSIPSLLEFLKYSYPYEYTLPEFIDNSKAHLSNFKQAIIESPIDKEQRDTYFFDLLLKLQEFKAKVKTTKPDIESWCNQYGLPLNCILAKSYRDNFLNSCLSIKYDDCSDLNEKKIQQGFYNYFYGLYLDDLIDFLAPFMSKQKKDESVNFDSLFKNKKDQQFTLQALEELSLTREGKSILSSRKKSSLRGFVEALKEEAIIPNHNTDKLCELFAAQIAMPYTSRLKYSETSKTTQKALKIYIKQHR